MQSVLDTRIAAKVHEYAQNVAAGIEPDMSTMPEVKRALEAVREAAIKTHNIDGSLAGTSSSTSLPLLVPPPTTITTSSSAAPRLTDVVSKVWRDTPDCEVCLNTFTFLRRRHHCRTCHKCICDTCSVMPKQTNIRTCVACSTISSNSDVDRMARSGSMSEMEQGTNTPSDEIQTMVNSKTISTKQNQQSITSSSKKPPSTATTTVINNNNNNNSSADETEEMLDSLQSTVTTLQSSLQKAVTEINSLREESAARGTETLKTSAWRVVYVVLALSLYVSYATVSSAIDSFFTSSSSSSSSSSSITAMNVGMSILAALCVFFSFSIIYLVFLRPSHPLARSLRAFYAVAVVLWGLRKVRAETVNQSDEESEPVWDAAHRVYARFLVSHLLALRGLWVKVGQYMSSRADVVPEAYVKELSKLQDANPAGQWSKILATIERELGVPSWKDVFTSLDEKPLGSASIAQVHRGKLRFPATVKVPKVTLFPTALTTALSLPPSNTSSLTTNMNVGTVEWEDVTITDVAVKIQHDGIETVMKQDLWTLDLIVRTVAWLEKDYDFRPVITEWSKESVKELNFVREAAITRHMAHITAAANLPCGVPNVVGFDAIRFAKSTKTAGISSTSSSSSALLLDEPLHRARVARDTLSANIEFPTDLPAGALATRRILISQFIDGTKITDLTAVDASGVDRTQLLTDICAAYAIYLHVEGVFSGDPHPANVLVDKKGKPWLIDYGLTKILSPSMRHAFASMVAASSSADAAGLLDAFDAMGLKLSRESPGEDLDNMRFMLRDTLPPAESKKRMYAVRKVWAKRIEKRKAAKLKRPVEAFPADLLLYLRAGEILRGLGASLSVRVRYLDTMAAASIVALRAANVPALMTLADLAGHGLTSKSRKMKVVGNASTAAHTAHLLWIAVIGEAIRTPTTPSLIGTALASKNLSSSSSSPSTSLTTTTTTTLSLPPNLTPAQKQQILLSRVLAHVVSPPPLVIERGLESRVYSLLASLYASGKLRGAQVAVVTRHLEATADSSSSSSSSTSSNSHLLVNAAFGEIGPFDSRPVQHDTLFNVFSVTKGVVATLVHATLDELARVTKKPAPDYDTLVSSLWPAFASRAIESLPDDAPAGVRGLAQAKQKTTLRHALTHAAGLQHAIPSQISMTMIADLDAMMSAMEEGVPVWAPGAASSYHYYTFGWIAAGILRALVEQLAAADAGWRAWYHEGCSASLQQKQLQQQKGVAGATAPSSSSPSSSSSPPKFSVGRLLKRLIADKLGLQSEMFIGIDDASFLKDISTANHMNEGSSRLAVLCGSAASGMGGGGGGGGGSGGGGLSRLVKSENEGFPVEGAEGSEGSAGGGGGGGMNTLEMLDSLLEKAESQATAAHPGATSNGRSILNTEPSLTLTVDEARRADVKALINLIRTLREKVYLFDPRLFNRMALRKGEIPAANGHFTARALATMYSSLAGSVMAAEAGSGGNNDDYESSSSTSSTANTHLVSPSRIRLSVSPQAIEKQQTNVFVQGGPATSWGLGYQLYGNSVPPAYNSNGMELDDPSSTTTSTSTTKRSGAQLWGKARVGVFGGPTLANNNRPAILGPDEIGAVSDADALLRRTLAVQNSSSSEELAIPSAADGGTDDENRESASSRIVSPRPFGHSGLGGSLAFADPATGTGVAILINQLSSDKEATSALLKLIGNELQLPTFSSY